MILLIIFHSKLSRSLYLRMHSVSVFHADQRYLFRIFVPQMVLSLETIFSNFLAEGQKKINQLFFLEKYLDLSI